MDSATQARLMERVRQLEQEVRELRETQSGSTPASKPTHHPQVPARGAIAQREGGSSWSRRALLLGGMAAAVGGAASVARAAPAEASTGNMIYGALNNSGTDRTALLSSNYLTTLTVENTNLGEGTAEPAHGIATATNSTSGAALRASGNVGTGVLATSNGQRGLVAGAIYGRGGDNCGVVAISDTGAPLRVGNTALGSVPIAGSWTRGDFVQVNGELWFCVSSGIPGSWRLLASPGAAGAFVPITPARVYDSRYNSSVDSGIGPLESGGSRRISVATAFAPNTNIPSITNVVPVGARALAINLTITGPTGAGYTFIAPGTTMSVSGSSINWPSANVTFANGLTVAVDGARRLKAFLAISGGVGSCHFLVDVNGYYLGR